MPTVSLPDRPNLDHLRQQAHDLLGAVRAHDPAAVQRIAEFYPGSDPAKFTLSLAQLVIARGYGFASWPRLKSYVEAVVAYRWESPAEAVTDADPADQFCRLACLNYTRDDPAHWSRARELLAENPQLTADHVWAAAAAAQVDTVRRLISVDPHFVRQRGGPYGWTPLFYLAYSRLGGGDPLATARLLLEVGADPNEGYLWNGGPYAFTLLTGVFGEGEQGPQRQPVHPRAGEFARLLLAAGADPNDSQALYNRQFRPGNDHLELLLEYGLGTGAGGPWKARLDEVLESPPEMLRSQLRWAIQHGFTERVRLLLRYNVDATTPYEDRRTPLDLALLEGNETIAGELPGKSRLDRVEQLIAAVMRADRAEVNRIAAADPGVIETVRSARPGLIVWAAAQGRIKTVELLLDLGFDVNAFGRGDVPHEQPPWETALHAAASEGHRAIAELLLDRGADRTLRDKRFDATPLGWAEHGDQPELISLLSQ